MIQLVLKGFSLSTNVLSPIVFIYFTYLLYLLYYIACWIQLIWMRCKHLDLFWKAIHRLLANISMKPLGNLKLSVILSFSSVCWSSLIWWGVKMGTSSRELISSLILNMYSEIINVIVLSVRSYHSHAWQSWLDLVKKDVNVDMAQAEDPADN